MKLQRLEKGPIGRERGHFDARYGWTNVPGTKWEGRVALHTNSIGARGAKEFGDAPPEGARRVVCLGDSFTYGSEVADGEDWPTVIDRRAPELEVINLGVGGWALDQAYLRWQDVGRGLEPDAVVLGLFLGSVGRHVNRYRPLLYPQDSNPLVKPRFRLEGGELVLVPQPYSSRLEVYRALEAGTLLDTLAPHEYWAGDAPTVPWSNLSRLLACRRADLRRRAPVIWSDPESEPVRVTVALLERMTQEARASGAEVVTLIFPGKGDWVHKVAEGWERGVYWRTLRDALDRRAIPYIDLFPVLRAAGGVRDLYREVHLSPAGNRAVADAVEAWIEGRPAR